MPVLTFAAPTVSRGVRLLMQRHKVHLRYTPITGEFTSNLTSASDRSIIVKIHGMHIAALLDGSISGTKPHRNHLTGFSVVAEAGGVRHADELVRNRVTGHFQWFRNHFAQRIDVSTIGDDYKFTIIKLIWPPGIGGVVERHGESLGADISEL